ncbi:quinone-dependent dihydroorotate dehydrogenase [bacterium]|nr:quinone-dependent dihydroorotate dehydrogenase [bacterium]
MYRSVVFPLLRQLDAEVAHDLTARGMSLAQALPPGRAILRALAGTLPDRPVRFCGVDFPNPIGVAAGFDKEVRVAAGMGLLGFGHVEVGTLTPRPQPGNPKPRVFRLPGDGAVINRMGFPNPGIDAVLGRLAALSAQPNRRFRIGVSLGKQKETPLAEAAGDYRQVMAKAWGHADYLAVNISSPNTPGLRELQGGRYLGELLRELREANDELSVRNAHRSRPPLLVKIAPDLSDAELDEILANALDARVDGMIATNTTLSREGISDPRGSETGGLSGRPLTQRSTAMIARIHKMTEGRLPLIAVGGVFTADDVRAKLDAGAQLVQIYTGLIYEGPGMAGRILRSL